MNWLITNRSREFMCDYFDIWLSHKYPQIFCFSFLKGFDVFGLLEEFNLLLLQYRLLLTCESQSDHLVGQLEGGGPVHRPRPLYPGAAALSDPRHACPGRAGDGRRPEHTLTHAQSRTPMWCAPLPASIHGCSGNANHLSEWRQKKRRRDTCY